MCGICVVVDRREDVDDAEDDVSTSTPSPSWLVRRGPDAQGLVRWKNAMLQASVLGMRQHFASQPVVVVKESEPSCSYLCWNGEVYQTAVDEFVDGKEETTTVDSHAGDPLVSDTEVVADRLRLVLGCTNNDGNTPEIFLPKLARTMAALVNAEFAFCFATGNWIYYGKDRWGRRSLLTGIDAKNQTWYLSSVATRTDISWNEVEPGIIFAYNVKTGSTQQQKWHRPPARINTVIRPATLTENDPSKRLYELLLTAVRRRIVGNHKITVLFSGGLDSVVLAALVLQERQEVTLVNVSFVAAEVVEQNTQASSSDAADTRAAIASYHQLQELFPQALIQFQQRQVSWNEVQQEHPRLRKLIFPKDTVMDLNICTAFWFAANAVEGRILLTGLGADEQMGGYGRHRKAWQQGGNGALRKELQMDQDRLWERNLGRDDRVLSDTSKEVRYPFLDTDVVTFLAGLDLCDVCDFRLPPGKGDKLILRRVADTLGLTFAAQAVKRAIQFGSRIAHVSDKQTFGSRRKASGKACLDEGLL